MEIQNEVAWSGGEGDDSMKWHGSVDMTKEGLAIKTNVLVWIVLLSSSSGLYTSELRYRKLLHNKGNCINTYEKKPSYAFNYAITTGHDKGKS